MVVPDGAKCYPRLCEKHGLFHASCSHRQYEFVKTIRRHHGNLHVHTVTIYGVWHLLKQAIPDQLVTIKCKNKAEINSSLWAYIQTWQWRWEVGHTGDACMKATGKKLSLMAKVNMSRSRRAKSQRNAKKAFLELHFRDLVPSDFIAKHCETQ